jgi:hypothetical protein
MLPSALLLLQARGQLAGREMANRIEVSLRILHMVRPGKQMAVD